MVERGFVAGDDVRIGVSIHQTRRSPSPESDAYRVTKGTLVAAFAMIAATDCGCDT